MSGYPQLEREALVKAVTGVQVREGEQPLFSLFKGTVTDVEGDVAKWDEVQPIRTLDTEFEARDGLATNTATGTVRSKSSQMVTTFKKREIKPETLRMLRAIGSEAKMSGEQKLALLLGDMTRRYYFERMEFLIAGALLDTLSFTVNGVTHTPDFGLAAGHNLTASASWATATTDIDADIETLRRLIVQDSGRAPQIYLCGRNVFGYLRKNSTVKEWFTAREGAPASLAAMLGQTLDLYGAKFVTADSGYISGGVWTPHIGDDLVIPMPTPSQDWFQIQRGTVMVPNAVLGTNPLDFTETYGVASWARLKDEPPSAWYFMRWAGLACPVFPSAYAVFDTTP